MFVEDVKNFTSYCQKPWLSASYSEIWRGRRITYWWWIVTLIFSRIEAALEVEWRKWSFICVLFSVFPRSQEVEIQNLSGLGLYITSTFFRKCQFFMERPALQSWSLYWGPCPRYRNSRGSWESKRFLSCAENTFSSLSMPVKKAKNCSYFKLKSIEPRSAY